MNKFSVTISGTIGGKIWMPAVTCWKDFSYRMNQKVRADETFRDAICNITNDGDFQSCEIVDATVKIEMQKAHGTYTRYFDIRLFKSVSDCVMDENSKDYSEILDAVFSQYEDA